MLYFIFALIPLLTVAAAFFPELTGHGEAVPAGGFEYSIYLPKRWLILGGFGVSAFGILCLLVIENPNSSILAGIPIAIPLALTLIGEVASLFAVILYFGYRLTVRGGVISLKQPLQKEILLPISQADGYTEKKRRNGSISLVIRFGKRRIYAEGRGCELLAAELAAKNVKKF